jgi:protein-S-isoprenylcysteine O-methyltransferase
MMPFVKLSSTPLTFPDPDLLLLYRFLCGLLGDWRFSLDILAYIDIMLFAIWSASELIIALISLINRLRAPSAGRDRFSLILMWLSIIPPISFALLIQQRRILAQGPGSFPGHSRLPAYLGWLAILLGMVIRLMAVATLRKYFTTTVSIVKDHQIVASGMYKVVRHPAYLGTLTSLLGFGLASANWFSLGALIVLPTLATFYRIHVEEMALLKHFGHLYQDYASQTKRLLPGIY